LYPSTIDLEPTISFDDWKAGENATPKKISLKKEYQLKDFSGSFIVNQSENNDSAISRDQIVVLKAEIERLKKQMKLFF
jgi:hypothetical protein